MKDFFFQKQWSWLASGLALGIIFLFAVALVKPIGVSTQFVILDAIVWNGIDHSVITQDKEASSGYSSPNSYLNKSGGKYAKNAAKPWNYSFVFVLAMIVGAFLASKIQTPEDKKDKPLIPEVWQSRFGDSKMLRYGVSFLGGFLVLFGARLAGGCTSGHMMSGMMQTSLSAYIFAIGVFAVGIPVSIRLYKGGSK